VLTIALFKIRSFNFSYFSLFAIFLSFLPVYLSAVHLSESQIGLIVGAGGVIGIVAQPFWGFVSDRMKTIKRVLLLLIAVSIFAGFVLFHSSSMALLFVLVGLMYFLFMPTDPLVESLNYQTAQRLSVPFGSIRMYGALGYAVSSFVFGIAADKYGMSVMAYLFAGVGIAALLLGSGIQDAPAANSSLKLSDMKRFLSSKQTIAFFTLVSVIAIPHRMNDIFVGIYVGKLGGSLQLVGYSWSVMTIIEFVFFAIVHRFLKKGSELALISVAALFYTVRFLLSSIVNDAYWIVALQLLQGLTFVFFYSAAIQHLYAIIPEQWKATGQTILAVLFFGISGIVGSVAGGFVFDSFGGSALYQLMALLSAAGFALSFYVRRSSAEQRQSSS